MARVWLDGEGGRGQGTSMKEEDWEGGWWKVVVTVEGESEGCVSLTELPLPLLPAATWRKAKAVST